MTSRHGSIMCLIVGALVLMAALRLLPARSPPSVPCRNPVGVLRRGELTIRCAPSAQISLLALLGPTDLDGCAPELILQRGEMVSIEAGCRFTQTILPGAASLVLGLPLDLNRATRAELILLPSIGPVLAARIVKSRQERGRFGALQELTRVRGIGPRTIDTLRSLLRVAPQSRIKLKQWGGQR